MSARIAITELGEEVCCSKCNEYWPADSEFYYRSKGKIVQPCKACYAELPSVIAKAERQKARRQQAA